MFNPFINPYPQEHGSVPLLREAFPDWKIGYGIFDALADVAELPWETYADSEYLDLDYFGNHSGCKFVAPVVANMVDSETGELTDSDREVLAKIIWLKFQYSWTHLWETNVVSYNPIHNYNMTDTRTLVRGDQETQNDVRDSVDSTEHGRTTESMDFVYGMNNVDQGGKPSDRSTSQEGGETVVTTQDSTNRNSVSGRQEEETIQRSGNIGVTTTQQMLSSERELWMWNFFGQVYKDIDTVLALSVYDPCRL